MEQENVIQLLDPSPDLHRGFGNWPSTNLCTSRESCLPGRPISIVGSVGFRQDIETERKEEISGVME